MIERVDENRYFYQLTSAAQNRNPPQKPTFRSNLTNTNGTPNPLRHRFVDSDFRAAVRRDRKSERGQARPCGLDRATRVSRKRAAQFAAGRGDRDQTGGRARTEDCSSAAFAGL